MSVPRTCRRVTGAGAGAAQAEHEKSQSRLFELESSREERTAASQQDADLAAEEARRTQHLLECGPEP